MPVFEAPKIGFITTVAVTFWYAWLFNHASGSSLLTLISHGVEGGVETNGFWSPGADLDRLNLTYAIAWSMVVLILLVADRRFWEYREPADALREPSGPPCDRVPAVTPSTNRGDRPDLARAPAHRRRRP